MVKIHRVLLGLAMLAMVIPLAPAAAEEPPPPDPAPPVRLASPEIFGYLTYWDLGAQIDFGAITTIAYFGLSAGADGQLVRRSANGSLTTEYSRWLGGRVDQVIRDAHANGVRVVLTVDRMAWSDSTAATTRALLSNPEARLSLADDIAAEVSHRGVDGVSLDFEPILSDQRDNFASFLGELRAALDAINPAYQLTFAATGSQPGQTYQMFGAVTASGAADAVIIMGYPLRGIDARRAGGLSPVYSPYSFHLKQIVGAYLYRVSADKVILALPWYGRDWPTQTDELNALVQPDTSLYDRPYNVGYGTSLSYAIANGRRYDPAEQSAWTAYRSRACLDCPETWNEVYYEDADTMAYKYDWAVNTKGLRGVGVFALGYDSDQPEMWKVLRLAFRGLVDTSPPSGSFALATNDQLCTAPRVRLGFQIDDGADGSGAVFVRLSNVATTSADGVLSAGRTFPAATEIPWSLADPDTGGSSATGSRTVYAQWRDVAGNWSPVSSTSFGVGSFEANAALTVAGGTQVVTSATIPVRVDVTGGGRTIAAVRLSSSGATTAGVLTNGVNGLPGSNLTFSLIDPATGGSASDGRRSVYAQWRDSAGCWSEPVYGRVTLDRSGPLGSLSLVDAPTLSLTGAVGVLAPGTDAASGVAELALSNDGVTWQSMTPSNEPVAWDAGTTPDGSWTISARWRDGAGNWSPVATTSLTLDRHGPVGALLLDGGAAATNQSRVIVTAPATDISGVAELLLSNTPNTEAGLLSGAVSVAPGATVDWGLVGADTAEGAAEVPNTVYAQWRDSVGHLSDVASATITVDRSAPSVSAPQPGFAVGTQLGAAVPVIGTWLATDALSGVASEQSQLAHEGQAWQTASAADGKSPYSGQIDLSSSWQFMASATDGAGNVSEPVAGEPFHAQLIQDSATTVRYGGTWKTARYSGFSGSTTHYSITPRATATVTFTGRAVAWVAPVGPKLGRAKVFVDGVLVATVDLGAAGRQRVLVFSQNWTQVGQHTVRIKVLATTNRARVDLDGFLVLA